MKKAKLKAGRRTTSHKFLEADLDPLLPSQVWDQAHFRKPSTGEERLAWRFLERNILDVAQGPRRARLKYIEELETWMSATAGLEDYSFSTWCGALGVDEGFMKTKFGEFLKLQRDLAERGVRGQFKILRQIEAVRVAAPHSLSKVIGEPQFIGQDLYECLSCGHRGNMSYFEGFTCVRGQPQPENVSKGFTTQSELEEALALEPGDLNVEGNNQPLDARHIDPVQDEGRSSDVQLHNWDNEGGCALGGGESSASCVGTVAVGAAAGGSPPDAD